MTAEFAIRAATGGSVASLGRRSPRGCGANEAPRRRVLLVAPDDCNACYASTSFDKGPVS
jgi:hypothetical protein